MIKADEARKVTQEALEAHKKKQTLEEARKLAKLFEARMSDADKTIRAAMKRGEYSVTFKWDADDFPHSLKDRFESAVIEEGFGIQFNTGDEGELEITINWKGQ